MGHCPQLLERYKAFYASLWDSQQVPHRVLELCRLRIAAIHGCCQELAVRDQGTALAAAEVDALRSGDCSGFAPVEQAAIVVAEQFPFQHHQISDETVAVARAALGTQGLVALMIALAFFDATCRWKLAFALDEQASGLDSPPFRQGALV